MPSRRRGLILKYFGSETEVQAIAVCDTSLILLMICTPNLHGVDSHYKYFDYFVENCDNCRRARKVRYCNFSKVAHILMMTMKTCGGFGLLYQLMFSVALWYVLCQSMLSVSDIISFKITEALNRHLMKPPIRASTLQLLILKTKARIIYVYSPFHMNRMNLYLIPLLHSVDSIWVPFGNLAYSRAQR